MIRRLLQATSYVSILSVLSIAAAQDAQVGQHQAPPLRAIPGITAKDLYPMGCVDCHINYAEQKLDVRFSTLLKRWAEMVEPQLLDKVAGSAPPGLKLKGKHPAVPGMIRSIPAGCLTCHSRASTTAPPFSRMLHAIHLTGGKDNHFLTLFQGECTHCHKLNAATGAWSLASGPEK